MQRRGYKARRQLALPILIVTAVLADENPLVSNGTCYYAAGKVADSVYIPCGNDAFGVYACCMNGDTCLSSNACYNAQWGDTYIAGCTDPTYSNPSCGNKGAYGNQQWTSLVRCFVSNDTSTDDEQWAACYESNQPVVTSHDGGCVCTASAHTAVFTDNPVLTNIAVLPAATGDTISFDPGHTPPSDLTPTAPAAASTTSASSAARTSSSSTTPTKTSSTTPFISTSSHTNSAAASTTSNTSAGQQGNINSNSNHSNLSTGAEAGIGVGVGLGVLLLCAILFLLYRRRIKQKHSAQITPDQPFMSPYTDHNENWSSPGQPQRFDPRAGPAMAAADMRSPAWSGHKSELPAEERSALMTSTQPSSMALGSGLSEIDGTWISRTSNNGVISHSQSPTFTAAGTGTSSNSTNRSSWVQPRMGANIQNVYELPGTHM